MHDDEFMFERLLILPIGAALVLSDNVSKLGAEQAIKTAMRRAPNFRFAIGEHVAHPRDGEEIRYVRIERLTDADGTDECEGGPHPQTSRMRTEITESETPEESDYRLVKIRTEGETWCGICEVFYRNGEPYARTEDFVPLAWEIDDDRQGAKLLELMRTALEKPVLDGNILPSSETRPKQMIQG